MLVHRNILVLPFYLHLELSVPFAHTGVDCTGHYYLRDDQGGES